MKLPHKPSKLLSIAIADLEAVKKDKRYVINMGRWHSPFHSKRGIVCHVCLAGSVMAKSLKTDYNTEVEIEDFDPKTKTLLNAIDHFRCGSILSALASIDRTFATNYADKWQLSWYKGDFKIIDSGRVTTFLKDMDKLKQAFISVGI